MAITITDPELIAQLRQAGDEIEFRDGAGELIARFTQESPFAPPLELMARGKTKEELAASRAQGPGRSLEEILTEARARKAYRH